MSSAFDQGRKAQAEKAQALLEQAKKTEADAAVAHAAALQLVSTFTAQVAEATRHVPTQERVKLAFVELRKQGFKAHMRDVVWDDSKAPKVCFTTEWFNGEPVEHANSRFACPTKLHIAFSGTEHERATAITTMRLFGLAADSQGEYSIVVEPRILRCGTCGGRGYHYGSNDKGKREDCATCKGEGTVPNPAGVL